MRAIKFSHRYKKMPIGVEYLKTWIQSVIVIDYKDLTEDQIKQDTETIDGKFYQLPQTRLINIILWSETIHGGKSWGTMRRWTSEKWDYYKHLVGQQVQIKIEKLEKGGKNG